MISPSMEIRDKTTVSMMSILTMPTPMVTITMTLLRESRGKTSQYYLVRLVITL